MILPAAYTAIKNTRHREFARLVALEGCSDMEACRRAGYSAKSAHQNANRLRANESIQAAIDAIQEEVFAASAMSRVEAVKILSEIARTNLRNYMDDTGRLDLKALRASNTVISKIEVDERVIGNGDGEECLSRKIKVWSDSPKQAIESLSKMAGWNSPEQLDHKHSNASVDESRRLEEIRMLIEAMSPEELTARFEELIADMPSDESSTV